VGDGHGRLCPAAPHMRSAADEDVHLRHGDV
jgi:hypothetical protein